MRLEPTMNLHLAAVTDTELLPLMVERARQSRAGHILVDDPTDAEMNER